MKPSRHHPAHPLSPHDAPYGLALPSESERIDYPLRASRLCGYLALAGLACLDQGDSRPAAEFADALVRLSRSNEAGLLAPVLDDQIIELAAIWMLWLRLGMYKPAGDSARALLERLAWSNRFGLPLPALYVDVRTAASGAGLTSLVYAHMNQDPRVPGFVDTGSTLVPLALWVCHRGGCDDSLDDAVLSAFRPRAGADSGLPRVRVVYPQSWRPPRDAADEWYAHEIRLRGTSHVYDLLEGAAGLLTAFEAFHGESLPASPAADWKVPAIDWMAWSTWRTPPPMSLFVAHRKDPHSR